MSSGGVEVPTKEDFKSEDFQDGVEVGNTASTIEEVKQELTTNTNGTASNKRKYEGDNGLQQEAKKQFHGDGAMPRTENITEYITCPENLVGKLIGRGGETINIIQNFSRCKVQVAHKEPGETKKVTIVGTKEGVEKVKELVEAVLYKDRNLNEEKRELMCPQDLVGKVIGKSGDTIKALQQATGVRIHVIQDGLSEGEDRKVNVSGRADGVELAYKMIYELINTEQITVRAVIQKYSKMVKYTESCPKSYVGKIIGKNGDNIQDMIKQTRARIQIDQTNDPCTITIEGTERSAKHAQTLLRETIQNMDGMKRGGGNFNNPNGQQGLGGQPQQGFGGPGGFYPQQQNFGFQQPYMGAQVMPTQQAQPAAYGAAYSQYYGGGGGYPQMGGGAGGYPQYSAAQYSAPSAYGGAAPAQTSTDWQEVKDPNSGRSYFYNRVTNQSQWEKPLEMP